MSEANHQRIYLTCGSIFFLLFDFATALAIVEHGPGSFVVQIAVLALTVAMLVLLVNSALLFAASGGPRILVVCKSILWFAFALMALAFLLCILSIIGSM